MSPTVIFGFRAYARRLMQAEKRRDFGLHRIISQLGYDTTAEKQLGIYDVAWFTLP